MFVDFSQTAWPSAWFLLDSASYILPLAPLQKFLYLFFYTIFFFLFFSKIQFLRMLVDYSGVDWAIRMKRFSSCGNGSPIVPVSKICPICSSLNIVTANYILFTDYVTLHYFTLRYFIVSDRFTANSSLDPMKLDSFFKPCPLLLTPCFKRACVISLHIGRKKYDS